MDEEFDDPDLAEDPSKEPNEKYPIADFSNKARQFRFEPGVERVDLGRMGSGYYLMPGRRRCISEFSVDRSGQIFVTYFFSTIDLGQCDPRILFQNVKAGHINYEHDPDIKFTVDTIRDDAGNEFFALDVLIADRNRQYRQRAPAWWPYGSKRIPIQMWSLYQSHRKAQNEGKSFLLVKGQTGDASWGDSTTYRSIPIVSEAGLFDALSARPNIEPHDTYADFNHGVVDARDMDQPFNESQYTLAKDWKFD